MKISYNWLKDYIKTDLEPEKLSQILTDIGLEVEGTETYEEIKGGLKNFFIGHVITCKKHPNADKLSVTTVDINQGEPLKIVCGAPNVAAGQKVVVATEGAEIYFEDKSFTIKKTKLRGEPSEGMICAEDELGLGTSHDGIMVLDSTVDTGIPAADYFKIKTDTIFEIGLTPNRIDAGSHYGVARDLAVYLNQTENSELILPDISSFKEGDDSYCINVKVLDNDACIRYAGLTIKDVKIAESPSWLKEKLKSIGLNPINNVVDITNFVLHELGQPLHAFDADKLEGNEINVKKLPEGTKFITLDEEERILSAEDLMICDSKNGSCMAGIFGGLNSGVADSTKNIFLESACFNPVSIRKSAKRHGLSTDSSFRFERGVDPNITIIALKRAALLISEIAGGTITSKITDIYPNPVKPFEVTINFNNIDRLIGKKLDRMLIKNILTALEIEIIKEYNDNLDLKVPPYRVDVKREADVIEDILRIYGYNNVEFSEKLNASLSTSNKPDNELLVNKVSDFLASNGFNEIMSNSLTRINYYEPLITFPAANCVKIINPLSSDLGVLRQTLLFNGLEAIQYNINRQNSNLKLFEYGRCYNLTGKSNANYPLAAYNEQIKFGLFVTGNKYEATWTSEDKKADFFYLKAYCEKLVEKMGINLNSLTINSVESKNDIYSGGLIYSLGKNEILEIGLVSPKLLKAFDIEQEVFYAELLWDNLIKLYVDNISFKGIPKYPEVRRDLALLIDEKIEFSTIVDLSKKTDNKLLKRIELFDFYKGKGIPEGKKSYGVSFYIRDENKTLTDKEIDKIMNKISGRLINDLQAELR